MVAALFGLHPINVESVAWVTERKNVLCAVFWMLTLLAYARYAERPGVTRYLAVFAACALALLSKPLAVTLPFALLLLDFWPLQRHFDPLVAARFGKVAAARARALRVMDADACHRSEWHGSAVRPRAARRALQQCAHFVRHLSWRSRVASATRCLLSSSGKSRNGSGNALGGAARWRQFHRVAGAHAQAVFAGGLVLVSRNAGADDRSRAGRLAARADRFTYIAQIGLFWAVVWLVRSVARPRVMAITAAAVILAFALLTARQVTFWNDSITLFEHTLSVTRPNARVESLIGTSWANRGDYPRAALHFQKSLRLMPDRVESWNNLGAALTRLDRDADAAKAFAQALVFEPDSTTTRYNLARTRRVSAAGRKR